MRDWGGCGGGHGRRPTKGAAIAGSAGAEPPRSRLPPSSRDRGPDPRPLPAAIYRASPGRPPLACPAPAAPPAAPRYPPPASEVLRCSARPARAPHRRRNPRPPLSRGRCRRRPRLHRSKWRPRSGTRLRTASPSPAHGRAPGPTRPQPGPEPPPAAPSARRAPRADPAAARPARSPSPLTASLSRTPGRAPAAARAGQEAPLALCRGVRRAHSCAAPTGSGASGPRDYRDTRAARRLTPAWAAPAHAPLAGGESEGMVKGSDCACAVGEGAFRLCLSPPPLLRGRPGACALLPWSRGRRRSFWRQAGARAVRSGGGARACPGVPSRRRPRLVPALMAAAAACRALQRPYGRALELVSRSAFPSPSAQLWEAVRMRKAARCGRTPRLLPTSPQQSCRAGQDPASLSAGHTGPGAVGKGRAEALWLQGSLKCVV